MGKEAKLLKGLFQDIVQYVRINHAEAIDKAYSYFWEGENPDEFLGGTALSLGFHNFEDWMVFDYKISEQGDTFIDLFINSRRDLGEEAVVVLKKAQGSVLSLYEVSSVSKDKRVLLKDILLDKESDVREKTLTRGLKNGDLFAARLLDLDGHAVMAGCVYPYLSGQKQQILAYIDRQFRRYIKNVNQHGTMRDYLKDYGDVFNLVWMNFIIEPPERKG
jgi:hypothetical protein